MDTDAIEMQLFSTAAPCHGGWFWFLFLSSNVKKYTL